MECEASFPGERGGTGLGHAAVDGRSSGRRFHCGGTSKEKGQRHGQEGRRYGTLQGLSQGPRDCRRDIARLRRGTPTGTSPGASAVISNVQNGKSCLHAVALFGHANIVELLLAAGTNPLLRNSQGETASDLAEAMKDDHIVRR